MRAISRWLDRFCYNHPNFGIPNLMKLIVIGNVMVYLLDMFSSGYATLLLMFHPYYVLQGQIWRLITFIFVPTNNGFILWFILSTLFYYYIGNALEQQWGTARFTVFYGIGVVLNLIIGFVFTMSVSMYYVNMSMFFSFATLYPEMQVMLYGIIPIKIKWLAWLDAALFAYTMISGIINGQIAMALLPVVAILNYFIFFWDDLMDLFRRASGRVSHHTNHQTINFKKAQRQVQERKGYLHKCSVCGITDADNPNMEFRYCSKCNGYYCYCMDHINNHTHVQ